MDVFAVVNAVEDWVEAALLIADAVDIDEAVDALERNKLEYLETNVAGDSVELSSRNRIRNFD